jgi:hypothetical protein
MKPSDVIFSSNRLHWNFDLCCSRLLICHRRSKQFSLTEFRIMEYTLWRHVVRTVSSAAGSYIHIYSRWLIYLYIVYFNCTQTGDSYLACVNLACEWSRTSYLYSILVTSVPFDCSMFTLALWRQTHARDMQSLSLWTWQMPVVIFTSCSSTES